MLTRGEGQGVFIGDDVRVTVVEVRGRKVRLMVEAPEPVDILRDELTPLPGRRGTP